MDFVFASYKSPDLELEKLAIQNHKKSLLFLARWPEKGQYNKTENLDNKF